MKNIHDDPCSTDLGIYEAKDLVPNWPASLGTDVFAQRYTLLVVHATLDWIGTGLPRLSWKRNH